MNKPSKPKTRTVPEIIDDMGDAAADRSGVQAISAGLDIAYTTVASWKERERIPPEWWDALVTWAHSIGRALTNDELAKAHARVPA